MMHKVHFCVYASPDLPLCADHSTLSQIGGNQEPVRAPIVGELGILGNNALLGNVTTD